MNIVRENLDNQTVLIKVNVGEADYAESVDKTLRGYRKKANVPGFRPGMVPMGIINKMYRKGVIAEETYRMAARKGVEELNENKIKTLGELMPSPRQKELDFDNDKEFEFAFEIGLAPEVALDLNKKDKVERYVITVSDEMLTSFKENYLRRFGKLEDTDTVTSDEALTVTLDQEDMQIEDAYVGLVGMSEEERAPFIGKKVGHKMEVDVNELYKTPSQRAAILSVKEDELDSIDPKFTLEITKIRRFVLPELTEEFFKEAFPEGNVTNEKEFDQYAEGQISQDLARQTEFKFVADVKKMLIEKAALTLPDDFLKNWLHAVNEGKFSMEEIEKDYPQFAEMMKWDLIQRHFMESLSLEVKPEELQEEAKSYAAMQFAYYGMPSVNDEMLTNYAQQILGNQEEAKKIYDRLAEKKVVAALAEKIAVKEKKVTTEEFNKLFE